MFNTKYTIEYQGAKFIFKDPGIDAVIQHLKAKSENTNEYIESSLAFFYANLMSIEGLEHEGEEVTSAERLKELNPSAHDILKILRAFNRGLMNVFGADSDEDVKFSKNG
jgi:hypothetical protein